MMLKFRVFAGLACVCCAAALRAAPMSFDQAESVWPRGLATEMNTRILFRAPFELKAGERATLKMVAWYSYRVTVNGAFVGFGPARGPKGFFRPDAWDLSAAAKPGANEVCVEVAGYNVPNFYVMQQPPFFKGEIVVDGRVVAASKSSGGAFAATEVTSSVRRLPRYSFQRTFAECYRLPAAEAPALALAPAPEPRLIERRVPYPLFETNPRMTPVSFAEVKVDLSIKPHVDRSLTLPGKTAAKFRGYCLDELEVNTSFVAQQLAYSGRRDATAAEKSAASFPLAAGMSAVFDNGLNDAGFPGVRVEVKKPGRLVLQFDEVLNEKGEARGITRYRDCCNAIVWDFSAPGVYEVDGFEPYVMRYVQLDALTGDFVVSAPRFRSYKNPTARGASFRASDAALVKIFDAARETFRQNAVDIFTDCPSRERAGWNCDAYFTAPVSTLLTGNADLERVFEETLAMPKAFDDIPDGMIPMCYPSDHTNGSFIPNWALWFVLETEEYFRRTGDRETVEQLKPRFEKLVAYLRTFRNSDGLLEKLPSWVFVEWSRCNKLVQDVNYPSNMTWADALDALDRLYGRPEYAAEAKKVRETVRSQSWNGTWFCDNAVRQKDGTLKLSGECTETCQYYAFLHRVATPESHPALWRTLLTDFGPQRYDPKDRTKLLKHPEIWPSNAFIGNYLRLKLLERAGMAEQILRETKGYFSYMAERTGTLWENDTTCASCNHGFASYAAILLVKSVLGADVDLTAKTLYLTAPDVKGLDFCGATLPVGDETIDVDWRRKGGQIAYTTRVPAGWKVVERPARTVVSADDLNVRDPFVLAENGTYYLYASKPWYGGNGVSVYQSKDLRNWTDRQAVMQLPADSTCTAVWAPEVHKYKGAYWLFVTLSFPADGSIKPLAADVKPEKLVPRGVWVFRAESPLGPFKPVKDASVTPRDWMCLDGTLFVEKGKPWMVFCHEWCQTGVGRMMAAPLKDDLSAFDGEPVELFKADVVRDGGKVTDGPFLVSLPNIGLRMIWSNGLKGKGYSVIQCKSSTGSITGPWHMHTPLFLGDGGHGMMFRKFDGQLTLTLHQPNSGGRERMRFFPLGATWEGFSRQDWDPFGPEWQKEWSADVEKAIDERIERCRKADAHVTGLPAGAEVKVEQVSSQFLFGSNMFNFDQLGSAAMNDAYRAAFTNLFNSATIPFYWKEFEPEEGKRRYAPGARDLPAFWNAFDFEKDDAYRFVEWRRPATDPIVDFCRVNGIAMHGHTMLYIAWTPDWVWKKGKTPEALAALFRSRIEDLGRHYGDVIGQWDVVNESLDRTSTKENPGDAANWWKPKDGSPMPKLPKDFTFEAFKTAAASFPKEVRLAINDAWSMQNDAYAAFAKRLVKMGAKVDVVGFQKHIFRPANLLTVASGYPCLTNSQTWDLASDTARLTEIDELGLPIHISEITIPSPRGLFNLTDAAADEIQARVMRAYYRFWFSWPSIDRITYWNLVDGVGAKNERMSSGWFNRDMSKKRVYHVMDELINRTWRTSLTCRADAKGELDFRGFKGRYRLSWTEGLQVKTREVVVR